ncbi:MAG: histidinol-phosphatase HisJ family protein [Pseudomonadota bacterium]
MNQEKTNISFPVDYHIHTILCNHAGSSMDAYIKKAVSMGFQEICFLDHLTLTEPGHEFSMTPEEVPLYYNAVQTLKKRYIGIINIKAGLEIDFNPFHVDLLKKISESYAFDVIGSSLHFPGGIDVVSRKSEWSRGEKDSDYIYGIYLESLDKMLDHSYFDIVCHLDLVKKFGGNPSRSFENEFNCIIEKISMKKLTVEVNTSGYIHSAKEAYPSFDIIKKCRKAGVEISIGSDAHDPESIGQHYDTVLPLILRAGYKQISVFTKRKRSGIPLPAGYGNN